MTTNTQNAPVEARHRADATAMDDLKPCPNPWCDSVDFEARPTEDSVHLLPDTSRPRFAVHCQYCPQQGPGADTEAEAVTAWNTRTPDPEALVREYMEKK